MPAKVLSSVLAAASLAAVLLAPVAHAADLYPDPRTRIGSPYDDPRYRDMYGFQPAPRYVDRADLPPPPPVYDTDRRGYLRPMPPPAYVDQRHWAPGHAATCVPREHIRRALKDDGWSGFHDLDLRGPVAVVFAYRPDGRLYRVKVDRCSGAVIGTRLIDHREHADASRDYGPSDADEPPAYDPTPRGSRWDGTRSYRY